MNSFVIGDPSLCIGCKSCLIACAKNHTEAGVKGGSSENKRPQFRPRLQLITAVEVTVPVQCRHCEDSPCARVCPEKAIIQKDGYIDIVESLCVGCKTCVLACPFGAINVSCHTGESLGIKIRGVGQSTNDKDVYRVEKCDLCGGAEPACVAICPADALQLVQPESLKHQRRQRRVQSASYL